jgi:hypothetical protein
VTRRLIGRARAIGASRVRCRVGWRINNLQLLDHGTRPAMRDDERQRVRVLRANVNEVNVQAVDFGHEIRQAVQSRLYLAPVVLYRPIVR